MSEELAFNLKLMVPLKYGMKSIGGKRVIVHGFHYFITYTTN